MRFESDRKAIVSWCLYDWANSAFALTVMAAFFPAFFTKYWCSGADTAIITFRLGMGNTVAGLIVAVLSPLLGAIAGAGRAKKKFLFMFICVGVVMTSGLFFVAQGQWLFALTIYIFARMGFSLANLFYDAFIIDVALPRERDVVSSLGYGLGYLGCGILFGLNILMYNKPSLFGLKDGVEAIRISFLSAAAWWLIFSFPVLFFVREKRQVGRESIGTVVTNGLGKLRAMAADVSKDRNMLFFILAYWFYIDGVDTVVIMAKNFGLSIGLPMGVLMIALLCVQFVAFPCAVAFGFLARHIGAKNIILICIVMYILITVGGAWVLKTGTHFIIFACLTGTAQGAIQALSRSLYSRMIPQDREGEYFGLYNTVGKFAVILGPAIVAVANIGAYHFGLRGAVASRCGISALAVLFFVGGLLLLKVKTNGITPCTPLRQGEGV